MKYVDFRKYIEENGAPRICLLEGEEEYFRTKGSEMLVGKYVMEPTLDYASFDGAALKGEKIKTLVAAVESYPFLSERRVVRVTEFYPTEKDYEGYLKPLFENPPEFSLFLIVNTNKSVKGAIKLSDKPNVTHVDCGRADEETIKKWIYVTAKRAGLYIDGVTCGKLVAYCTLDMARVAKETEKLITYARATGSDRITDETVDEVVYPDSEYKIYELATALSRKNYSAYMRILKELLTKGFDELSLLSSLVYHFKGLYEVVVSRGTDREIATALGMKEYAVRKSREQAQKLGKAEVLRCYRLVNGAIGAVKSGELTPPSALDKVTASLLFGG
ncbi:MAG: DNA polymerase III subunit delta [Clostridia bacterium]|nr:DNA polymerase III subunit delta [Clostridia bacterium]